MFPQQDAAVISRANRDDLFNITHNVGLPSATMSKSVMDAPMTGASF